MGSFPRYLPEVLIALVCCAAVAVLAHWAASLGARRRRAAYAVLLALLATVGFATMLAAVRISMHFDHVLVAWVRCLGLVLAALTVYACGFIGSMRKLRMFDPGRRRTLRLVTTAAIAAPAAVGSFAVIRRDNLTFRELDVRIPSLPPDLNGLRIAQLSDLHLSPFVDESTVRRAVSMANELRPHLTFVTGDLISTKGDPLDVCLSRLSELRAEAGLFGCMGNHEHYADAEDYTQREAARFGLRFLRREAAQLRFGSARLNLAGIDYQRRDQKYLVGMESLVDRESFNVLLSHNPDVFPVATRQGYDLTISGHTHGGQVNLEMIHPSLNISRFYTPFVYGLYERERGRIYVSRGVGTIGLPARLGAPPEVVLLRLCAI
jgi:predicted MPP superfamily phosphohydrolase